MIGRARIARPVSVVLCALTLSGCGGTRTEAPPSSPPLPPVHFTDITAASGLQFTHITGGTGLRLLPESLGPGCALVDYDQDGWLDVALINSGPLPGSDGPPGRSSLYHNNRDGTFTEVTDQAGFVVVVYGMAVTAGDYTGNGYPDLYVTGLQRGQLFRNNGDGTFTEVTDHAGVANAGRWGTACAWLDYDRDGRLDLFIGNYLDYDLAFDRRLWEEDLRQSYASPQSFDPVPTTLYRNRGDGTFEEMTAATGLADIPLRALGVVIFDQNNDGWPDIAVASDRYPDALLINQEGKRFEDIAERVNLAYSATGLPRAGMGIDSADFNNDGRETIVVTNFLHERIGVYQSSGSVYRDRADQVGIGGPSHPTLGWGVLALDYDLDGWLDLIAVNGHVTYDIGRLMPEIQGTMPALVYHNERNQRFREVVAEVSPDLARPRFARGLAAGDIDNDGDLDLLVTLNGQPGAGQHALLFRNDDGAARNWVQLRLLGTESNPDAYGARVVLHAGGLVQQRWVRSGSSYFSHSDPRVVIGLGSETRADRVMITWPSGHTETLHDLATNRLYIVQEGRGILQVVGPGTGWGRNADASP